MAISAIAIGTTVTYEKLRLLMGPSSGNLTVDDLHFQPDLVPTTAYFHLIAKGRYVLRQHVDHVVDTTLPMLLSQRAGTESRST